MKPRTKLAEAKSYVGGVMSLYEHDGAYSINFNSQELMHSKASASESLMGNLGTVRLDKVGAFRVLVGGLGLGFTLKNVLSCVGPRTTVEVVELIPEVVEWNRTHLKKLNGALLDDPRVKIRVEDVTTLIRNAEPESYDAILLDVDNGPVAMVAANNYSLYSNAGIEAICAALKPGGRAVVWSAGPDGKFENRLRQAGLRVKGVPAKMHERARRDAYMLYVLEPLPPGR